MTYKSLQETQERDRGMPTKPDQYRKSWQASTMEQSQKIPIN